MEDLIEELISIEIIDETDTVIDNVSKKKTLTSARRLEFFEMLQRREELLADGTRETGPHFIGGERPAADEVRALASYLSNNVTVFKPPHWSIPMLRRLLLRCSISTITQEDVLQGRYVYVRGVPASFCCLLLHGQLQIRAGNEGFISEIGPWTTLALPALTDAKYTPDFTARVECAARILIISRAEVLAVLGASEKYPSTSPVIQGRESISAPVGERKRDSPLTQRHAFGGGMPSSPSQQAGSLLAGSDARLLPSASEAASLDAQLDEERSLDGGRACDGVSAANGASAAGAGGVSLF